MRLYNFNFLRLKYETLAELTRLFQNALARPLPIAVTLGGVIDAT
jgi:hypothetical protein